MDIIIRLTLFELWIFFFFILFPFPAGSYGLKHKVKYE